MNLAYLGDALDHWKGSVFEFLVSKSLLRDFKVDPMATDHAAWTPAAYKVYAELLRVEEWQILQHSKELAARDSYFREIRHTGDLFMDPDIGINTGGLSPVNKHIKPREMSDLLQDGDRVLAVYQHPRAKTRERVKRCVEVLADQLAGVGWCSYESATVAILFFSRKRERTEAIAAAFRRRLGKPAEWRIWSGIIAQRPQASAAGRTPTPAKEGSQRARWAAMARELEHIVSFLQQKRIKATYRAVGEMVGLPALSVGRRLGPKCPKASWVVSKTTGDPTGYSEHEKDAHLDEETEIIESGADLARRMKR